MKNVFTFNNNKKKQIICFFLLLFAIKSNSQIDVFVTNKNGEPINQVNVFFKNINNQKDYFFGYTDVEGKFQYKQNKSGNYSLKISCLGYKTVFDNILINQKKQILKYVLLDQVISLNEIVIKDDSEGLIQIGDTLKYKIDKFLNGTEETLKDVIKKLPGLDVDAIGNIKANGKTVDKLLIDGEDFFQNQQKLATENITSAMIKNIELINNFKEFKDLNKDNKSGLTAINIKIKEKFKNKIVGNIEAGAGNKFRLHSTLFNFSSKQLFNVISDSNNNGEQSISILDYENFVGRKDRNGSEQVEFVDNSNLPRFLTSGNRVKNRENYFTGFNLKLIPSKKLKLYLYSIFNKIYQDEELVKRQEIITPSISIFNNENIFRNENFKLNNNFFELIYKPKDNIVLNNNLNTSFLNNDNRDALLNNSRNVYTNSYKSNLSFENISEFSILFNNKSLLNFKSNLYFSNLDNKKEIKSNSQFLDINFNNDEYFVCQQNKVQKEGFGIRMNYLFVLKKIQFNFSNAYNINKDKFDNDVTNYQQFKNDINLKNNHFKSSLNGKVYLTRSTLFKTSIDFNHSEINFKKENYKSIFLTYEVCLKHNFDDNHYLSLSYNFLNEFPLIDNLLEKNIIVDYRNVLSNQNISYYQLFKSDKIMLNYYFKNLRKKITLISNFSFLDNKNFITSNMVSNQNYNYMNYFESAKKQKIASFVFWEKGINYFPYIVKGSVNYSKSLTPFFSENIKIQSKSESFSNLISLRSQFKKSIFYHEFGYYFSLDKYINNGNEGFLSLNSLFLDSSVKLSKNLILSKNLTYKYIKSSNNSNVKLFLLSPKLRYVLPKSRLELSLSGQNVLNFNKSQELSISNYSNTFEETKYEILNGNILFNIKYNIQ